jgi:hypothetical protein
LIPLYTANLPDQTKVMVDSNGVPTKTWWLVFRAVWSRTGLGSGVPNQVDNSLSGAGTTQATAPVLNVDWNEVLTTPVGSCVSLLSLQPGQSQTVYNGDGANSLNVYPPIGWKIDALGANAPYSLASGKTQIFGCYSTFQFRSLQLG